MIKYLGLLAISLFTFPLYSNAAIVDITYSAYVSGTQGSGLGYRVGDSIEGTLRFNTNYSNGDVWPETDKARYEAGYNQYEMVTGYHNNNIGNSVDFVEVYNDSHSNFMGGFEDFLSVSDSNSEFIFTSSDTYISNFFSLQLQFAFQGINWITDTSLGNVDLLIADIITMGPSWGVMTNNYSTGDFSGNFNGYSDSAFLNFTSVSIKSVNVAEPGSLALMLMLALGVLTRRKHV